MEEGFLKIGSSAAVLATIYPVFFVQIYNNSHKKKRIKNKQKDCYMLDYLTNYGQQTISLVSLALSIVIALASLLSVIPVSKPVRFILVNAIMRSPMLLLLLRVLVLL